MGSRLGRRVVDFANLPIKLMMPTSPSLNRNSEIALKTIPSASKIEIRRVLESLYGFEVDDVRTLNMEGKKKKRGGLLVAKPDYKKAYVTLRTPLSLSPDLFPIPWIEEERQRTRQLQQSGKTTVVEGEGEGKSRHWLDEGGRERGHQKGYFGSRAKPVTPYKGRARRGATGDDRGGSGKEDEAKFPWSSMRSRR